MDCGHGYVYPADCDVCARRSAAEAFADALRGEPDEELRAELVSCLAELNALIKGQVDRHEQYKTEPWGSGYPESVYAMLDTNGRPLMADVLAAKANILTALARLP